MTRCYFQLREKKTNQSTLLASDMMRHLHSRQYLGKALVICDSPFSLLRVARKQWLKLARTIQRQRSSTLNADKILRFTYAITHMQHMQFTAKSPFKQPEAHVFFCSAQDIPQLPLNCFTIYLIDSVDPDLLTKVIAQAPEAALFVDYDTNQLERLDVTGKIALEGQVTAQWEKVAGFLESQDINVEALANSDFEHIDSVDNALDTLLGISHEFLRIASDFQHTVELAQPLRLDKHTQQLFNTVTLLAYRVQALTPGALSEYMLRTYHEENTFFLHDIIADLIPLHESLLETIIRHQTAGRVRLALAIQTSMERFSLIR